MADRNETIAAALEGAYNAHFAATGNSYMRQDEMVAALNAKAKSDPALQIALYGDTLESLTAAEMEKGLAVCVDKGLMELAGEGSVRITERGGSVLAKLLEVLVVEGKGKKRALKRAGLRARPARVLLASAMAGRHKEVGVTMENLDSWEALDSAAQALAE